MAAVIFVLDKKTDLISAPHALVYLGIVIFFVYFKMSSMLLGIADPFLPFENIFRLVLLSSVTKSHPFSMSDHLSVPYSWAESWTPCKRCSTASQKRRRARRRRTVST